ncbi:MAG TPA: ABC transporter permease [Steroidobacteraceae bacterium]|nr:ABC transporter permease [Steroidobacteraceae bacterium]
MLGYYFHLAVRSLRRNLALTLLAIAVIGVGTGASMSMLTILRAASGDPIPEKSTQLFTPQIDNFGPQPGAPPQGQDELPTSLTYTDAVALMQARGPVQQAAMYPAKVTIIASGTRELPLQGQALATDSGFFPMFDVPFEYGGAWSRGEDKDHAPVVVLAHAFNDRLFGGANSVGRSLMIDGKQYRIIGVTGTWQPSPHFYDLGINSSYSSVDQLYLPFTRAIDEQLQTSGGLSCDNNGPGKGWSTLLHSNCVWINIWVELPRAGDAAKYKANLRNYAAEQRHQGRVNWPPHVALRDVMRWLDYNHVVPAPVRTLTNVSYAILLVCIFNAAGLLLSKFMTHAASVGVRRALGATRSAIFAQYLMEAGVIGLAGGLIGIGLTKLGLVSCRSALAQDLSVLTRLGSSDMAIAFAMAIAAALVAGLYPTWRATRVPPGLQLKAL